jgi:hypothetical protein
MLTLKKHGHPEPIHETTAVTSYEIGRMLEQSMYMSWAHDLREMMCRRGLYLSELPDVITQLYLICGSMNVDFLEQLQIGLEKIQERFTGKETK